jgi:hypothetical protein
MRLPMSRSGRPAPLSALGVGGLFIALESLPFVVVGLNDIRAAVDGSILVSVNAFGTFVEGSWVIALLPITLASLVGGFWTMFGGRRDLVVVASVAWLATALVAIATGRWTVLVLAIPAALVLWGARSESDRRTGPPPRAAERG